MDLKALLEKLRDPGKDGVGEVMSFSLSRKFWSTLMRWALAGHIPQCILLFRK